MSYDQARKDHEYLWQNYWAAADMTGAYVDQDDLKTLLETPTKKTAENCYENQIRFWFQNGPEPGGPLGYKDDPEVEEIADRYFSMDDFDRLQ